MPSRWYCKVPSSLGDKLLTRYGNTYASFAWLLGIGIESFVPEFPIPAFSGGFRVPPGILQDGSFNIEVFVVSDGEDASDSIGLGGNGNVLLAATLCFTLGQETY